MYIDASNLNAAPGDLYIYDLILLPVDEWAIDVQTQASGLHDDIQTLTYLDIDSVGVPKVDARTILRLKADDTAVVEWIRISSGASILQANVDQRLWFLMDNIGGGALIEIANTIQAFNNWRYQAMRGSR